MYNKVKNNQLPTHAKYYATVHKVLYYAKLSNKQSAKVIYRFDRHRTAHSNR